MILANIAQIKRGIEDVCRRVGRNPAEITLVAVTKFAAVIQIEEALGCGITHIGENKVQQALEKYSDVGAPRQGGAPQQGQEKIIKHMIGHLQTNKVKDALKIFDIIESVDSLKLAQAIDAEAKKQNKAVDILIQVNISGEEQKFGAAQDEALRLVENVAGAPPATILGGGRPARASEQVPAFPFENIRIKGLMTIAPMTDDERVVHECFRKLRELRDRVKKDFAGHKNISMDYLSMGMTNDYKIAIEEGSNMVRIGRAIFQP